MFFCFVCNGLVQARNRYKLIGFWSNFYEGARWINTDVNVEDHVFVPEIDPDEINEDGQSFVNDYVSRLTMIPFERSRPLWDIHILNVQTSDAEAVGVMRCHHSLADGMSLMSLLVACTRKASDPKKFPTIPAIKRQAALSRYMNRRYGNINAEGGTSTSDIDNLPGGIRLRTGIAVNLRQEIGIQPVVDMGKSIMDRKKHSLHATMLYSIIEFILNIFGSKVSEILIKRPLLNITTFISNIVGPVEEISLHDNQITYIALSCYGQSQALIIHFLSYAGKMIISIAVDPRVIPDPQNLCDEMEESLKAMKDNVSGKSDA
ncbi:hypothetical protein AALP_AA8G402700 [Arabis alpina]|uniref:Uncharacterized protein n=1 Tax=Arabis alpina TaxID=50452 RepID=A0A087GCI1_ARAAL|nr:hypothetical protein AALP_AA8G402700 [Arabis alpina]